MNNETKDFKEVPSELNILKGYLPGIIEKNFDIYKLNVSKYLGSGTVRYTHLQNGLHAYDFDLKLNQNIIIPVSDIIQDSLLFIYCLDGSYLHQFDTFEEAIRIEQFQTAVMHCDVHVPCNIIIKENNELVLNLICIDKEEYLKKCDPHNNLFHNKIQELLANIESKSKHFHLGNYNLKIAEQLKLLFGIEYTNEVSELLSQKGRYYLILAKHIEQFHLEIENNSNTSGLLKEELKAISEISEYIQENPELQHTIKSLCLQSGLTPAKLQEGFKFMFERTVSDFVRNVRIEKAEKLIRTTDLTMSEIVYSIGLTSRSYFCKIFKRKYLCSPKEYRLKHLYSVHDLSDS